MKKTVLLGLAIIVAMLLTPIVAYGSGEKKAERSAEASVSIKEEKTLAEDTFRLLDTTSNKISTVSAEAYVFGVVAAEMPALYDIEALKSQAVASYTYACYKRNMNKNKNYDITTDYSIDQSFSTDAQLKEKWGESWKEYSARIKKAVNDVSGEVLMFEDKPILAVYHALSCGDTYSAKEVWGNEIKYLVSVPSPFDTLEENYICTKEFTEREIKKSFKFNKNNKAFTNIKANSLGLVKEITVYGEKMSGSEIRSVLDLPSSNFIVKAEEGKYIFSCKGYGHGVGMSQKGANSMAKQGFTYKEILSHYYRGAVLV